MIRILIIVPYQEIYELMEKEIEKYDTTGFHIQFTHLYGTDRAALKDIDADIVVARGITFQALSDFNPHVHVVPILQGPNDLLEAFFKASEYPDGPIGLLSGSADLCDTAHVTSLIGREVKMFVANDQDEIVNGVEQLRQEGCGVFLGGLTTCRYCEGKGYSYVHIKSGLQSINRAIQEAVGAARSMQRSNIRMNILTTLVNNDKEALIALNNKGTVVVANATAEKMLGKDMINRPIGEYYEGDLWSKTLTTGEETERIETIHGMQILISSIPIMTGSEGLGVLLTLQNIETIRLVERKIRKELSKKGLVARYTFSDIITRNKELLQLVDKARRYSKVDGAVLLIGETGTGKELFAQSIHNASKRRGEPFVAVNCAALPETLLESELFGYCDGAFSGAAKGGKQGLFELAHKGTIFLDEIGEMPIQLQAKLLRVLQEKEVRRVGGDNVVPVDVRVISATNVDISTKVKKGEFRLDLFYRISLLNLRLIALHARTDDIPLLFSHFVKNSCEAHHVATPKIDEGAYLLLQRYPWPGNVRELRNAAERLVVLMNTDTIGSKQIEELDIDATALVDGIRKVAERGFRDLSNEELYRDYLDSGLSKEDFAKSIGMSRTTLWRRISSFQ